jgi:hypothetical protein
MIIVMKNPLINLVRFFVNLAFYGYLLFIPVFWFMMLSEYLGEGSDQVLVTQIQHGQLLNPAPEPRNLVAIGAPFAIVEESARLWIKTNSLAHFIFFSNLGDTDGFGMNFITMFFGFVLIFLLKKILDSIRTNAVFTAENAQRIMLMGWVLIAKYFYTVGISFWMSTFLENLELPYKTARGITPDGSNFHVGILLF